MYVRRAAISAASELVALHPPPPDVVAIMTKALAGVFVGGGVGGSME